MKWTITLFLSKILTLNYILCPQHLKNCCEAFTKHCKTICSWMGKKILRFSRPIAQYASTTMSLIYLVQRVDNKFSDQLDDTENACLLGLNFIGLAYTPYNLDFIRKTCVDAYLGFKTRYWLIAGTTVSNIYVNISNFAMLVLSTAAAVEGLKGNYEIQDKLYNSMVWWGVSTIVAGTVNNFTYVYLTRKACDVMTESKIKTDGLCLLQELKRFDTQDSAIIHFAMDKDTIRVLSEVLKENDYHLICNEAGDAFCDSISKGENEILVTVRNNLITNRNYNTWPQLILTLGGDALLAVEKWAKPKSATSTYINSGVSILYSALYTGQAIKEAFQREALLKVKANSRQTASID